MDSANVASAVSPKPGSSLTRRLISGFALFPLILGAAYWSVWAVALVVALASVVCLVEFYGVLHQAGHHPRMVVGAGSALLLCAAATTQATTALDLTGAAFGAIIILSLVSEVFQSARTRSLTDWALTLVAACYVGGLLSYYVLLRELSTPLEGGWLAVPFAPGAAWVFVVLLMTWLQDIAAYVVGRLVGRHKMFPSLSPGKTWEGAVGGFLASVAVVLLAVPLFGLPMGYLHAALLGAAGGVAGPLGDLSESFLKRQIGVKDMSNLMPGHGGLLDRIDSMLFTAPVSYALILLFVGG